MEKINVTKYKISNGEIFYTEKEAVKRANELCRYFLYELIKNGDIIVHNYNSSPKSTIPFTAGMTIHFVGDRVSDEEIKSVLDNCRAMFRFATFDLNNFASYFNFLSFLEGDIFGKTYKVICDSVGNLSIDPESLEDKILRLQHELEEATK